MPSQQNEESRHVAVKAPDSSHMPSSIFARVSLGIFDSRLFAVNRGRNITTVSTGAYTG
jgi:hypothetical protein